MLERAASILAREVERRALLLTPTPAASRGA